MLKLSTCPIIGICARGTDHATQRHKNCPPIRLLTNYALLPTHTESTPQATPISFLWDTGIEKKADHDRSNGSSPCEKGPLLTLHARSPRTSGGAAQKRLLVIVVTNCTGDDGRQFRRGSVDLRP